VIDVLRNIRVLDFCWVGAGALVSKMLAEHGADVIKVESRARPDNLRLSPPYRPGTKGLDASGYFALRNNDKRSMAINMQEKRGRDLARRLAAKCDVVTDNFRPGVMRRWGLDYDELQRDNPSVVCMSMPMQGADGPHRDFIGFGSTIAALAGLVHLSGRPELPPVGTGTHYPDHIPNPGHALIALLAVVRQRERTGAGRMIELSQLESTVNIVAPAIVATSAGAPEPSRTGNRLPGHSPSGVFRCAGEDSWCALSARSDAEWRATAEALGRPELGTDVRFSCLRRRKANEDELERLIAEQVRGWDRWELARALQARGVPAWPVQSSEDLLEDEHLRSREFWRPLDHEVMGETTYPAAPFKRDGERSGPRRSAPLLGEHTRDIAGSLLELGDDEIDRLMEESVLW
jgi:benzylsuccinate CoA-transferase BbsF subunit